MILALRPVQTGISAIPDLGWLLGSPYSQHAILWQVRGEPQYLETFRAGTADPGSELSHLGLAPPRDRDLGRQDLGSAGVWEGD